MKTAEELFEKYELLAPADPTIDEPGEFTQHTDCIFYDDFLKAIAEHDKEIISKIDEVKDKYCLDKWFTKDDVNDILTELKQWMELK